MGNCELTGHQLWVGGGRWGTVVTVWQVIESSWRREAGPSGGRLESVLGPLKEHSVGHGSRWARRNNVDLLEEGV